MITKAKRLLWGLAVAGAAAGFLAVAPGVATAAEEPVRASSERAVAQDVGVAACRTLGPPFKSGSWALANVSTCGGYKTVFILQRHRWWGWEQLDSETEFGVGSRQLEYNCGGSGTYTYRVVAHVYVSSGSTTPYVEQGAERRFTC